MRCLKLALCACSGFPRILSLLRVCLSFFPPLFSCSPFVPAFDLFHLALCFSFFSFPHPTTAGSQARGVLGQPWDNPDRGVSVLTWGQEKERCRSRAAFISVRLRLGSVNLRFSRKSGEICMQAGSGPPPWLPQGLVASYRPFRVTWT